MQGIRESVVAGQFYPASPSRLKSELSELLDITSNLEKYPTARGIISPHAGYFYSGKTAAYAFNAISEIDFSTVVVISPSHYEYFNGSCIFDGDAFETPLGNIPINKTLSNLLTEKSGNIFKGHSGHRREHGVEVILPFLQVIRKDFSLIPIVMGDQNDRNINELANALRSIDSKDIIYIASSDLSHFYSRKAADKLDSVIENDISNFDDFSLWLDIISGKTEACGYGPILSVIKTLKGDTDTKSEVLYRTDSGEASGDISRVVGYLSSVFYE